MTKIRPEQVIVTLQALNEEKNIGPVIQDILRQGYRCIVVDDGSQDNTAELARGLGARVVSHYRNIGQGFAVLTGFRAALRDPDCLVIIEMDSDGQHRTGEISLFLEALENSEVDFVVGSRIKGSNSANAPYFRKVMLPYFTKIIQWITRYPLTDAMCGFRAFRCSSLRRVSTQIENMLEPQYLAAEIFIRFAQAGLTMTEVPVVLEDRQSGASSKGFVRYGVGVLRTIIRTLVNTRLVR